MNTRNIANNQMTNPLYNNNYNCSDSTTISVDSICLWIDADQIIVKQNSPINVDSGPANQITGEVLFERNLFKNEHGIWTTGKKAYYNHSLFNLNFSRSRAFIHLSLPRWIYKDHNSFPISLQQAQSVITEIQQHLTKIGIHLNLRDSFLSRIDLFRNLIMNHPYSVYIPVFNQLHAKYMHNKEYSTTFNFNNKRWELEFYNKYQQLKDKNNLILPDLHPNTLRVELRLKSASKCRDILSVNTLDELFIKWSELPDIYRLTINNLIFSNFDKSQLSDKVCFNEYDRLEWFMNKYNRQGRDAYVKAIGYETLINRWGSDVAFRKALLQSSYDQSSASTFIKKMNKRQREAPSFSNSAISQSVLFNELYSKIIIK